MKSRLLANLEARIATEHDRVRSACLQAQRAVCLARQGHHDAVDQIVREIRESFGRAPNGEVTAWISLAEAVNTFYRHPGLEALDRLLRAQALSRALGHAVLQPLCSAWLAHVEFNANRMERMIDHAAEALRLAQPDHHAALSRVSLVIADAYHFAGGFDLAKDWYAAVRIHALAEGDDAMISAMMYNMATFRASSVRLSSALLPIDSDQARRAMLEAESTRNYDHGIGTASLDLFMPLLRAQLFTVAGKFDDALSLFRRHVESAPSQGLSRFMPCYYADMALCELMLGQIDAAMSAVQRSLSHIVPTCEPDDLATAYARVSCVMNALGDSVQGDQYQALARDQMSLHCDLQASTMARLQDRLPRSPMA